MRFHIYLMDFRQGNGTGIYVGASATPRKRMRSHLSELRRGRHPNPDIQHWFDVLGEDSIRFQTLHTFEADDVEAVCAEEERWMGYAVALHGRNNVLNVYLKSHRGSFANAFM